MKEVPTNFIAGQLGVVRHIFEQMTGLSPVFATPKDILLLDETGCYPLYVFKRGAITGWTWGILTHVNFKRFSVRTLSTNANIPLSAPGDCGAIWWCT